jgi:signal transduction histidine kinase
MKLKTKMILTVVISCLIVLSGVYAAAIMIIMPGYDEIEDLQTKNAVSQTLATINYRLTELYEKVRDYSAWDETYSFIQNPNEQYIEDNLTPAFNNLGIDLIILADNEGNLVYCKSLDLNSSAPSEINQAAKAYLQTDKALWNFTSTSQKKTGILLINGQPVFAAISPIVKNTFDGPIMGGMMFGKFLDSKEKERLTEIMGLNFSLNTIDDYKLQERGSENLASLNVSPQIVLVQRSSFEIISGLTLIDDLDGNASFVLQVYQNREVLQHGLLTMYVFIVASVTLSIITAIVLVFVLERQIIKPLTKLANDVKATFSNSANGEKYSKTDTDEVTVLTGMIQDTVNQKLEAMNDVSRMVAHDLRNPLTGIKGATFSLRRNYGKEMGEKGTGLLKVIDDCVEYSNKIVSDLWEYSSEIKLDKSRYTPHQLVNKALTTLVIPKNIKIIDHTNDDFIVNVDLAKMERVFSNLTKNAIDAMPDGGTIIISSLKLQNEAEIDFLDNGVGMSEEVAKKIGEPFFTTKAKGMGVGFSICKRIVEAHKGRIEVASTPGKGTKIMVFVPLN